VILAAACALMALIIAGCAAYAAAALHGHRSGPGRAACLRRTLAIAALTAVILVLIAVIIWLATRTGSGPAGPNHSANSGTAVGPTNSGSGSQGTQGTAPGVNATPGPGGTAAAPAGPHYLSVPLSTSRVVYVVDRGGSVRDFFDPIKASIFNSVESLGPGRQFAVVFWGAEGDKQLSGLCFPEQGFAPATSDRVQALRDWAEGVAASGRTELAPAVRRAAELNPDAVVLITAKGSDLAASTAGDVQQALGGSHAKVYTIDLTAGGEGKAALEPLADQTGGSYARVSPLELR
jgi:hypothetical protein